MNHEFTKITNFTNSRFPSITSSPRCIYICMYEWVLQVLWKSRYIDCSFYYYIYIKNIYINKNFLVHCCCLPVSRLRACQPNNVMILFIFFFLFEAFLWIHVYVCVYAYIIYTKKNKNKLCCHCLMIMYIEKVWWF